MLVHRLLPKDLAPLRPEVERALRASDVPLRHLRVASRRLDRGMPEQPLDRADVHARLEQMGGEPMSKRMRRHALGERASDDGLLQDTLDGGGVMGRPGMSPGKRYDP